MILRVEPFGKDGRYEVYVEADGFKSVRILDEVDIAKHGSSGADRLESIAASLLPRLIAEVRNGGLVPQAS